MSTKFTTRTPLRFAAMPREYEALCHLFLPRPIHDKAELENATEVAEVFAGFEDQMSSGQTDYFDLLGNLIAEYEEAHTRWPKRTPLQRLQYLVSENEISGAELSRILGASSRHLGPMILRGEREITAAHARALGAYFSLPAGTFIE
jgi:antitoxin component HigA of HigAB toxin-antitoxin module